MATVWDVGIATIFAREVIARCRPAPLPLPRPPALRTRAHARRGAQLPISNYVTFPPPVPAQFLEATVIIGQYRTVIRRAEFDAERERRALRAVWIAGGIASLLALAVILAVAIPLALAGNKLDPTAAMIVEGVSKVIAAVAIAQLSLKVPKWLGVYPGMKNKGRDAADLTLRALYFNVAWNIWREMAELGIFLIPYFLQGDMVIAVPLSAVVGIAIALVLGLLLYLANKYTKRTITLALSMAFITGWLSVGLFVGGCHEFEEVWGESAEVFEMPGDAKTGFWSHGRMPLALFKPFGYSHHPTQLQVGTFWGWVALLLAAHYLKYRLAKRRADKEAAAVGQRKADGIEGVESAKVKVVESTVVEVVVGDRA
jgi:high-affinity iron transporter